MTMNHAELANQQFSDALKNLEMELSSNQGDAKSRNSILFSFLLAFNTLQQALKFSPERLQGVKSSSLEALFHQVNNDGKKVDAHWLDMADDCHRITVLQTEEQADTIAARINDYANALRIIHGWWLTGKAL
jgi:hypothetical protein